MIPLAARPELEQALAGTGMEELFRQVEMPLLFSLDRMEKAGIRVERQSLEEYSRAAGGADCRSGGGNL